MFLVADNIISPLGKTTKENFDNLVKGQSGISSHPKMDEYPHPFYGAKLNIERPPFSEKTKLESLMIASVYQALRQATINDHTQTLLIISTTKGNIDQIGLQDNDPRILLSELAQKVNEVLGFGLPPLVISNACISGVSAIIAAQKWLRMKKCKTAIVCGGDLLTPFTLSGFDAFKAMDQQPCRPYDASRNGINLGEGVGTMIFQSQKNNSRIKIIGSGQANDANHISGPSRTGEGLKLAMKLAMERAKWSVNDIDFINAHGTATLYNDEMEAVAFHSLGLSNTPISSLKGYFGHTLGAAGVIESIIVAQQLQKGRLLPSLGYENHGVSTPIHIVKKLTPSKGYRAMKTISGFGGCNAALAIELV